MKWTRVKDRLPKNEEPVLVFSENCQYTALMLHKNNWHCICNCRDGSGPYDVTHWMPLPKDPNEMD